MKTAPMIVTSEGIGIKEALALTEKLGKENGLSPKSVLHLRLLGEELFGMLRGIAGEIKADYWIDHADKSFELHMKSDVQMTPERKEQFLAAASDGANEATKSFMGKVRVMIANFLASTKEALPYAMINTAAAAPAGSGFDGISAGGWSMISYREELQKHLSEDQKAADAWDELERSIVANIADDVKVRIVGKTVEITLFKTF